MGVTKRQLADQLGVTKQTVTNYISRLGLEDHVRREGQRDLVDDYAASVLAAKIAVKTPPDDRLETATTTALLEQVTALRDENAQLRDELRAEQDRHAREVAELRAQLTTSSERVSDLAERLADLAEHQQIINAAPWWRRWSLTQKLLGSGANERE